MEFIELKTGSIQCTDFCDIDDDDVMFGIIRRSTDGYWRFNPEAGVEMACIHMKQIMKKLSELNRAA